MVIVYLFYNGLTTLVLISTTLVLQANFGESSSDWTDCLPPCLCKWTYGKKSAFCASANITSIPSLNSELQVLDLQNNHLNYLRKDEFSSAGLVNLQRIFLKNSNLKEIHRDAFRDLKILVEIDLSYNQISVIPRNTFAGNERLKVLLLSHNPLRQLFNEQFPSLPHLRSLELDNCQIHAVGRDAFVHLDQLEKLNLRHNDLENLSENVFTPIVSLKSLQLDENPWKCDCSLRGFRNWYLSSKLHSISLICAEPKRLKDKLWEEISSIDFACPPELRIEESVYRLQTGDNVTFSCHVKGDPEPEVNWLFRGYPVGTPNATHIDQILVLEVEEGLVDKWVNISLFNLTKYDSGEYTCEAKNFIGKVSRNISLFIQQEVIPVTLGKADSPIPVVGLVGGSVFSVAISVVLTTCLCLLCGYQKRKRRHRRKGRIKDSGSFTEQDKKLLECSIATSTERQSGTHSMEMFGSCHGDLKMHESTSTMTMELCEPVHLKLDRRRQDIGTMIPITTSYPSSFGVYAPQVDYNSPKLVQSGTYGNIFISLQVGKDRHYIDAETYPDLLEVPCKSKTDSVVTTRDESTYCSIPVLNYATLPRRQLRTVIAERHQQTSQQNPVYDSLGKRVTMQGSSTLSLPDAQNEEIIVEVMKEPPITLEVDEYVSL